MIEMCNSLAVSLNSGPVALETILHALTMRVEDLTRALERQDDYQREMLDRGL